MFSYFLSNLTRSEAIPITPLSCFNFSNFFPLTDVIGKKLALPKLNCLKWFTNFLASSSESVTMFCILWPRAISKAVSYSFGTDIRFANTPCTPFFKFAFLSQSLRIAFTLLIYPSFSFSVSIKNFNLESLILISDSAWFIFTSKSFNLVSISFFLSSCFFSPDVIVFLLPSISAKVFIISDLFSLAASTSEILLVISCLTCFSLSLELSSFAINVDISLEISNLDSVLSSTCFFFPSISNSFLDIESVIFFRAASFSSNSFSYFSLFSLKDVFLSAFWFFSSSNSVILLLFSSISLSNLSWFSLLWEIFSKFKFISEFICSFFLSFSKPKFCISSIFNVISSIACFNSSLSSW